MSRGETAPAPEIQTGRLETIRSYIAESIVFRKAIAAAAAANILIGVSIAGGQPDMDLALDRAPAPAAADVPQIEVLNPSALELLPTEPVSAASPEQQPEESTTTTIIVESQAMIAERSHAHAAALVAQPNVGIDISWPNCGVEVPDYATFGIVGVNGGSSFEQNPCLADEAAQFQDLSLYVNSDYPGRQEALSILGEAGKHCDPNDNLCVAYAYGNQHGIYSVDYAHASGVKSGFWWLDVETMNKWRGDYEEHKAVLTGLMDAIGSQSQYYYSESPALGFYSIPGMWNRITGGWQNGFPAWRAIGERMPDEAPAYCQEPAFTGGKIVMVQYVQTLDHNIRC